VKPLVTDAAAPLRRSLYVETLVIADTGKLMFDIDVPAPAILRHVYARVKPLETKVRAVNGSAAAKGSAILVVLVFEVDPEAKELVKKRYYTLLLGSTMEGQGLAEMMFAGIATLPNGAPIAVYDCTPASSEPTYIDQMKRLLES
jgi:hypothetical protein